MNKKKLKSKVFSIGFIITVLIITILMFVNYLYIKNINGNKLDGKTNLEISFKGIGLEKEGEPIIEKYKLNELGFGIKPIEVNFKNLLSAPFKNKEYILKDKELAKVVYDNSSIMNTVEGEKSKIVGNPKEGYKIEKGTVGNELPFEDFIESIESIESIGTIGVKEIDLTDKYNRDIDKEVKELEPELEKYNDILTKEYKITVYNGDEVIINNVDKYYNKKWNIKKKTLTKTVEELLSKYETFNTNRNFTTVKGKNITLDKGIYGWKFNIDETVDLLVKQMKNLDTTPIKPVYTHAAYKRDFNDDIGNTYVEISLKDQKMYYIEKGKKVIETDVVTGDDRQQRSKTPPGVYEILEKSQKTHLRGSSMITGVPYVYPVDFWIRFTWAGHGIHDTFDRYSYGGDIYKYNGSSGCINTPYSKVEELYKKVDMYTPVVVY